MNTHPARSLLLAFAFATVSVAEPVAVPPEGYEAREDQRLLESVHAIAGRVEQIRDRGFDRPPTAARAPEVMHDVAAQIRAHGVVSGERLAARGRAWESIGFGSVEAPENLARLLAVDLRGAVLDPSRSRILVAPDRLPRPSIVVAEELEESATVFAVTGVQPEEPFFAHYVAHLLQIERSGDPLNETTTDGLLARSALAEGEANLLALHFLFAGMGMAGEVTRIPVNPGDFLDGELLPGGLETLSGVEGQLTRFVYLDGFAEVSRHVRAVGWRGFDASVARCRATRDLLHGCATARAADPLPDREAPEGLERVDHDSLGEYAIGILLSRSTRSDNLALQGSVGWRSDRLERWEAAGDERSSRWMTRWLTGWDGPEDATEFHYAYSQGLVARFPDARVDEQDDAGRIARLTTKEVVYDIERVGPFVRVDIAPAPPSAAAPDS